MPLLSDAKTCYVGTTPIKKIYAGSRLVWGALNLRMVICAIPGNSSGTITRLCAEFTELEDCDDCATLRSTYEYRFYALSGWTAWQGFSGWRTNTDIPMCYIALGQADDTRFQDGFFELRTNGNVEQVKIDLANTPHIGTISPDYLYC